MVCELEAVLVISLAETLWPNREPKKERVLACANTGAKSTAKDTDPIKRLKNNALFAFFGKNRLTAEEVSVL
jgi:hypothetical protein